MIGWLEDDPFKVKDIPFWSKPLVSIGWICSITLLEKNPQKFASGGSQPSVFWSSFGTHPRSFTVRQRKVSETRLPKTHGIFFRGLGKLLNFQGSDNQWQAVELPKISGRFGGFQSRKFHLTWIGVGPPKNPEKSRLLLKGCWGELRSMLLKH